LALIFSSSTNIIPVVTPENIDSVIINPIANCVVYTNNPYHDTSSANSNLPTAEFYTRLRGLAFICKECQNGFLPSFDRSECSRPNLIPNCKSYTNVECKECVSGFKKQKSLYREVAFQQEKDQFNKETFFNHFFEFASPYILLDPSHNSYLVRDYHQCKSTTSILNCQIPQSTNVCRVCHPNFYLDENFQCKPNPSEKISNCKKYISSNSCQECETNYVHQELTTLNLLNQSIPIYNCRPVNTSEKIPNCLIYKQIGTSVLCTRCQDNHFLDPSSLTMKGEEGFSNGCNLRVNSKFVGGCLVYSATHDKCDKCVQGLGLTGDGLVCLGFIHHCLQYNLDKLGQVIDSQSKFYYFFNFQDFLVWCVRMIIFIWKPVGIVLNLPLPIVSLLIQFR
jgi:hypothetical protein